MSPGPGQRRTILLVDDDQVFAALQAAALRKIGYWVLTSLTGEQAVEICNSETEVIDLILMDIELGPGIDGTQAAQEILARHDIPIVFSSSRIEPEIVEKTQAITGYGYVSKSSSVTVLNASIRMAFKLHEAYQTIRRSEERYSKAFHISPDSINVNRLSDGVYLAINQGFTRIMGYTSEEIVGRSSVSPELQIWDDPEDRKRLTDGLAASGEVLNLVARFRAKDGSLHLGMMSARTLEFDGAPCIISITRDITEERKAEQTIRESQIRYKMIFEHSGTANSLFDSSCRLILHNAQFLSELRLTSEQVMGMAVDTIFGPRAGAELLGRMQRVIQEKKAEAFIFCFGTGTQERWYQTTYQPLFDENLGITGVQAISQDVTENHRLNEKLRQNEKLDSIGLLAGGIAHDFNNLLAGLSGNLELARMSLVQGKADETLVRLEKAMAVTERSKALTRQLLTFSKGGAPVQKMQSLAGQLKEWAEFALSGSDLSLKLEISPDLWLCHCDSHQIGQIVDNLMINARQASLSRGTVTVRAENVRRDKPVIAISVIDTGTGIRPEILPKIFDPFFTTKVSGTGLGLATSDSIARQHQGWIEVTSEPGQGSSFCLFLPAFPEPGAAAETLQQAEFRGTGVALVMDDDEMLRDTLGEMLTALGFQVVRAGDGLEALSLYDRVLGCRQKLTLAMIDLTVPTGMDGIEAARRLREKGSDAVFVAVSGYSKESARVEMKESGFDGRLSKPFLFGELSRMLNNLFAARAARL